jgi:hypothetical protein
MIVSRLALALAIMRSTKTIAALVPRMLTGSRLWLALISAVA